MSVMLCYCCRKKLISSVNKYLLPELAFWIVKSQSIVTMMCETQELSDSPDRLKKVKNEINCILDLTYYICLSLLTLKVMVYHAQDSFQ